MKQMENMNKDNQDSNELDENVLSIIDNHDIDRPSSAPLQYIRKYAAENDKYELSL